MWYDETMQERIRFLGVNSIDINKIEQAGTPEYKMWIARKNKNVKAKKVEITPDEVNDMNKVFDNEINKTMGKRLLKNG